MNDREQQPVADNPADDYADQRARLRARLDALARVAAELRRQRGDADGETRAPRPVRLARPKSSIGTPASTGPYNRLRLDPIKRHAEARAAYELIELGGVSVRQAAETLGMSPTTAWRRARWYWDFAIGPVVYGLPEGPPPQQRGTRAVPRGRPVILPMDARWVIDQLLAAGHTLADIAASKRTVPLCVRELAAQLAIDQAQPDARPGAQSGRNPVRDP